MKKNVTCKTKKLYILLAFLLIAIAMLMVVTIYCYLIKCQAKKKHLLPYHITNTKLLKKCIIKIESNDKSKEIDIKKLHVLLFQ